MLNALTVRKPAGFTIIELMIAVVIMAILMALALPSFRTWMQNIQIRNAGGSITNGLQRARGEAVARNTNVSFVLAADSSWTVNVVATATLIESRSSAESSQNVTLTAWTQDLTVAPTVPPTLTLATYPATTTYNNFGQVVAVSNSLAQVDLTAPDGTRDMRVTLGPGGNAKMCDPSLATGSSPSAC